MKGFLVSRVSSQGAVISALGFSIALLSSIALAAPPSTVPGKAVGRPGFPQLSFPDRSNGAVAIERLGAKLPEVAAWYRMSPAAFTRMLREDGTAWIDQKGRLLFIDQFSDQADSGGGAAPAAAPFPLEDTFTLHSRPGANRVIYLDFDGHQTTGTLWNRNANTDPIISPPYSRDADPAFSTLEKEYIQDMWRQVSEDYAPFDVDVTTEDPGSAAIIRSNSSDQQYGSRVVITEDNFDNCGCGGFAYVGVFDFYGDNWYDEDDLKPAFVFNGGLVGAGEAITHEVGHNLGLQHDGAGGGVNYYEGHGSGATGWAPIMGVGYYQPLVQWSKGEYSGANNQQDDIADIQANGAPLMADDHSGNNSAATAMSVNSNGTTATLSASGLIHQQSDVDVFSFISGAGAYTLDVTPAIYSPNLDVLARLYDSGGSLVATSNPVDTLPASFSDILAAGEYYLHVEGTGKGDVGGTGYSDYGSLGRYIISGTVPDASGLVPPIAVVAFTDPLYEPAVAGTLIAFNGSGSTDPDGNVSQLTWNWQFGSEGSDTGENVDFTFTRSGSHIVTLTVKDVDNLQGVDTLAVEVLNQNPTAAISVNTDSGEAPVTINFDGSASADVDGDVVSHAWQFGDGASSTAPSPSHAYTSAGDFTASLTVTDNLGASSAPTTRLISVAEPPFVDQVASSQQTLSGSVSGSLSNTHESDGFVQSITERESGGKPRNRYSFVEHIWYIDVQPGVGVTLVVEGSQSDSSDDVMEISYQLPGQPSFQAPVIFLGTSMAVHSYSLPPSTSGEVAVRLTDSDQTSGNRSRDTAYIDQLYIRTDNDGIVETVNPPTWSLTNPDINTVGLYWNDNSDNEDGFRLDRSLDGNSWITVTTASEGTTSFQDSGLTDNTTYEYRVRAFRGAINSTWAETSVATLGDNNPPPDISLTANGFKQKGRQKVDLSWTPVIDAIIYRDNEQIGPVPATGSSYLDNIDVKGGGSYVYRVCEHEASPAVCSPDEVVTF